MAMTVLLEPLSLFDWSAARQAARTEAEETLQEARNALSKADTEYHEAFLEGGTNSRKYLATLRLNAAQDAANHAKETLRQLS